MMTTAASTATDRSDFRTVMTAGTKPGALIALGVVVFLAATRVLGGGGGAGRALVQALVVLAATTAAAFLPAFWAVPRTTEGVAGSAAIGLWGTIVFSVIDIALFRPLRAYPWTWDAVGGGSTWWYLPMWWMLGTYLAWLGGLLWAQRQTRGGGEVSIGRIALPVVAGAVALAAVATLARLGIVLPVAAGGGVAVTPPGLALAGLAREGEGGGGGRGRAGAPRRGPLLVPVG